MIRLNWNPRYRRTAAALWVAVPVVAALLGSGCSGRTSADSKGPGGLGGRGDFAVPVTAARAAQKDVPVQAQVIGAVEAYSTVTLKAQISGQLMEANFKEGDFVKKGQLMFTLDPRLLEAQLKQTEANIARDVAALGQSEANLSRDRAQQLNARQQRDRWAELYKDGGIISKEQFETYETTASSFDATVKADEAAIENAKAQIAASRASLDNQKIQLSYTKIYAPISGRTGAILVKPGNIVTANTTELAAINQVQPVFVSFSLPETFLPALRKNNGGKLPVRAITEDAADSHLGMLSFFDNAVDTSTGTIRLKATMEKLRKQRKIKHIHLSIAHSKRDATAIVIMEG